MFVSITVQSRSGNNRDMDRHIARNGAVIKAQNEEKYRAMKLIISCPV